MIKNKTEKKDMVLNPLTQRWVVLGGRSWMRLVKQGLVKADGYQAPNTLYETDEKFESREKLNEHLNKEKERILKEEKMPKGKRPVIKRNKIVYQKDKLTIEKAARGTADLAMELIDDIQDSKINIPADMTREEAHDYLKGIIFNRMISEKKSFKNTKLMPKRAYNRKNNKVKKKKKVIVKRKPQVPPNSPYHVIESESEPEPEAETEAETEVSDIEEDDSEYEYVYE